MLAKVSQTPDKAALLRIALQLPEKSAELLLAEETLRKATSDRSAAAKHLEDTRVRASVEGSLKRSPTITPEQLGALADSFKSLEEAEDAARAERDVLHKQYADTSRSALGGPVSEYLHLIGQKAAELEELLSIGTALNNLANRTQIAFNTPHLKTVSLIQKAYLAPMLKLIGAWR